MKRDKIKIGDLVVPKANYQTFLNKIGLVIAVGKGRHEGALTYKVQFGEQVAIFSHWGLRKVTYENR